MATDIRAIKALNDFPETPYEKAASQNVLEFRWIHGQCFQFRLPDGKVLMTDPFLPQNPKAWRRENTPVLDLNELGPVDYVTINHSHFDHTSDLPAVFKENSPIVICDRIFARELSAAYQVPEYNIWPIVPGMTYQFDSFRLDTVAGKHNDIGGPCDLEGARFGDPENTMVGPLNSYGCLFNTSFLFTLTNHYRIGFAAGVAVKGMAAAWKGIGIDLLLRQRLVYAKPKEYAEDCKLLGGQLIVPMHHDACIRHGCGKLLLHYLQRHCRFRVRREVGGHIIIHLHAEEQNRTDDRSHCKKSHYQPGVFSYPSCHSIHCRLRKMNILCHLYFKHISADVQQQFCEQLSSAIFFMLG